MLIIYHLLQCNNTLFDGSILAPKLLRQMIYPRKRQGSAKKGNVMRKDIEIKLGSTIYGKIQAAHMSERERDVAVNALQNAELVVDGIAWITRKIGQLGERLFLKPSLKH